MPSKKTYNKKKKPVKGKKKYVPIPAVIPMSKKDLKSKPPKKRKLIQDVKKAQKARKDIIDKFKPPTKKKRSLGRRMLDIGKDLEKANKKMKKR